MELRDLICDVGERGVFRVHRSTMTSPEIFALEQERIFNRCWLYLGHESEVEQPGDFVRRRVANRPMFFVRGQDGQVRAFLNTCPHRGALVCRQDAGNAEVFQCFYHAWSFNDRGELVGLPDEEGYTAGFERADRGLLAPRLESYRGFYFVSFDLGIEDLETYLARATEYLDLVDDLSETGLGLRVVAGSNRFRVAANWKLLVENTLDSYHVPQVHQTFFGYLKGFEDGTTRIARRSEGRGLSLGNGHSAIESDAAVGRALAQWNPMYGPDAREEMAAVRARLVERHGEERAARLAGTGRHLITYPNFLINDAFGITMRVFTPLGPDLTEATQWAIVPREESGPRLGRLLQDVQLATGQGGFVNPDDAEAVEACQAGFAATGMEWSDVSRGMHREPRNRDELQMRAFWRQWHAQIQGRDKANEWDDRPHSDDGGPLQRQRAAIGGN